MMALCTKCKEPKPNNTDFISNRCIKNKRTQTCLACRTRRNRARVANNKRKKSREVCIRKSREVSSNLETSERIQRSDVRSVGVEKQEELEEFRIENWKLQMRLQTCKNIINLRDKEISLLNKH